MWTPIGMSASIPERAWHVWFNQAMPSLINKSRACEPNRYDLFAQPFTKRKKKLNIYICIFNPEKGKELILKGLTIGTSHSKTV